ncbi:ABC transporter permease [Microbacterium aerolatum]|uniref:ABC transporter permease n=1 Tax=Microbacterium aerolatum TaxID=153731 RepID=A0A511ANS7_9MICO|nr:ABC transporter permease [Microbacterium aerolatum]GEK87427.1 ABC transporter permease [Microbacterium aerolatum]GGB33465.1 ABC transporter permease [Microbacterium aerolatum]
MITFILRRVAAGVVTVLTLCVLAFFLLYLSAESTARNIVGQTASAEIVARKASELGLDRPLLAQFTDWVSSAVTGDLGRSWFTGETVAQTLAARVPVTLSITVGAILLSAILSIVLGALAAGRRGWVDHTVQVASVVGAAVPGFLFALALATVFGLVLRWFPATGYVPVTSSVSGWLSTITLPIIALAIGATAAVVQQVRGGMIDVLRMDYVRTLRSRGLGKRRVVYGHVLRNAAGPALGVLGLQFIVVFGGAVVVEQVFSLPGLGQAAIAATSQGDIPVVMGVIIVTAVLVVLVNLAIDLLQGWLNPKVRLS